MGFTFLNIPVYVTLFICTLFFSFLLNGLFLKFSKTLGIRNNRNGTIIRWSDQTKPALGGITFYITFLLSTASYSIFSGDNNILLNKPLLGILAATCLAFLMGLSDDAYDTKPWLKFFAQLGCGGILLTTGTSIDLFSVPLLNYAFTLLWVIGIMNSINMLDNMDAIASISSIFIILSALLIIFFNYDFTTPKDNFSVFALLGVLSSVVSFLYFNWHPSKIYMGDTGSQFLGLFLAAISITYFWNYEALETKIAIPSKQIIITLLVFIIPIIDTTIVIINRLLRGTSPFIGGKDHTSHHLSYLGLSDKQVAYIYTLLSFISFVFVFIISVFLAEWSHIYTLLFIAYVSIIFSIMFFITRTEKAKKKFHEQLLQDKTEN